MQPTNKLRWVQREVEFDSWSEVFGVKISRVEKVKRQNYALQQWFDNEPTTYEDIGVLGEWRDVPIEVEE